MKPSSRSLRVVDLLGGGAVVACVFWFVWITVFRPSQTRAEHDTLSRRVIGTQQSSLAPAAEIERLTQALKEYREKLERLGQFPEEVNIESYFQQLSRLSDDHNLRVVRQEPLSRQSYPGIDEERYAYDVAGAFPDILAFLNSIEHTDFWADVSYLKLERRAGTPGQPDGDRVASLVISLFASRRDAGDGGDGRE